VKTATSAGRLPALLARLDAWLKKHRPRFAKTLLPGATPDQLAALERELGRALPDELRVWLAWHNGQSGDVPAAFVQSWHLLGTQQIAQLKKELDGQPPANWNPAYIPFLDDDNDNYVCVDTGGSGFPVRECWRGKKEATVVADSLTAWVERFVADVEKGEYVEDPERGEFYKR
jgi:cell wall assembly regulator SMI1